ncbi:FecR family protein [Filimonas lacunae]|nr:FecR family protein [Filimonas lacunae]
MNQTGPERVTFLMQQFAGNSCSRQEMDELMQYVREAENDQLLHSALQQQWSSLQPEEPLYPVNWEGMYDTIVASPATENKVGLSPSPIPLIRRRWWAVAAILLVAAGGIWVWTKTPQQKTPPVIAAAKDIQPGSSGAVLTLADGSKVVLDSAANGNIATQANASITKRDGVISYGGKAPGVAANAPVGQPLMNTLTTPRGRQYKLVLPDGTTAWLNAASSIEYPVSFTGKERNVSVTGEVYFEVAAKSNAPFVVTTPQQQVTVLGTSFNMNAYTNESIARTTLLQGSVLVKIRNSQLKQSSYILEPGQQATGNAGGMLQVRDVHAEQFIAWTKGYFLFDHASVPDVMRQLERWYDIEVSYAGAVPQREFGGKLERNLPLSAVLKMLETSKVHCKVEGRHLTVLP